MAPPFVACALFVSCLALLLAGLAWMATAELIAKVKRLANQIDREQVLNTQLQNELIRQGDVLGLVCQALLYNNILDSDIDEASKR